MKAPLFGSLPSPFRWADVSALPMTLRLRAAGVVQGLARVLPRPIKTRAESRMDRTKRVVDVLGSLVLLVAFSPVMGAVALIIRLDSSGPILFRQQRIGRGGRPFTLYKFRSMGIGAEEMQKQMAPWNERRGPAFKIARDPRHTRAGRWIRRMSLDELPNLINVLRGEMSLVGPRPPLPSEVAGYMEWQKRRLEAMPGVTGLWQVSGRSRLSFNEQCELDIYYIEHWSPWLDFSIMLRTIPTVLLATGAY